MDSETPRSTGCVLVLTTFAAQADIDGVARALVDERLAACVNILPPMRSIYRWKGEVEDAAERQVVIKTQAAAVDRLTARLRDLHPYEVPELLVVPIDGGGADYLAWIRESTSA
jgi:periplasmic divalent cation tolerance protein